MECPNCGVTFPVKDVCISAGPYSIYREVLIKNIHKYVTLLREASAELSELEEKGKDSMPFRESAKTVKAFMQRLKELLEGCRDKLRVPGEGAPIEYHLQDGTSLEGTLMNISTTGLCLKSESGHNESSYGKNIRICIKDFAPDGPINMLGEVVWRTDDGLMGVKFTEIDEETRHRLERLVASKCEADTPLV